MRGELPHVRTPFESDVGHGALMAQGVALGAEPRMRLHPTSLRVGAGESLAITGRNGAGKTSLLRVLAGEEQPDAGTVAWFGPEPPSLSVHLGGDLLFPELTVGEHFQMLEAAWPSLDAGQAAEELERWGMGGLLSHYSDEISSGQKQAVELLCTALRPVDVLIIDEPERRLDSHARSRMVALLERARDAGTAVVVATHEPLVAERLGALRLGGAGDTGESGDHPSSLQGE